MYLGNLSVVRRPVSADAAPLPSLRMQLSAAASERRRFRLELRST